MIDQEINSRVDAYRGNPGALQQKYAVSQQLIDLLALQKIKSEMDAKSRDIQLKMAQSGKKPPIAQQLQQEVVGRTKQEMEQQLAGTMQQEAMEKQKALQQAVQSQEQGVAGLPAPGLMPTKAMAAGGILDFPDSAEYEKNEDEGGMAAGGIVAFVKGGNVWDTKKTPYDELIIQEARRRGIDPVVFKRLIGSESSFNPRAVSPRGEKYGIGIAQIADVHNMSKEDRLNPSKAIPAAAELFAQYLKRADGNYEKALQMYKGASTEGGKQRMAGPIQRILEGVANVAIPSAYAGDKNAPAKQETSSPIGRFFDDVSSGKVTRAIDEAISPKGARERYDAQQKRLQQQREQAAKLFELEGGGFKQQTPEQQAEAAKTRQEYYKSIEQNGPKPPPSMPYPVQSVPNDQRKSIPYPQNVMGREVDPTAGQPVTDEAIRAMAAPPAPAPEVPPAPPAPAPAPAPQAEGITSVIPKEYQSLAKQQNKVLSERLGTDPEEMARQRGIEYYQQVGVPTERAAAESAKRLAGLEALDAEQLRRERENERLEALIGARGSSWQQAIGTAGGAGIAAERRNMAEQRKRLIEANTAKDALANIGLGVKQGVYGAQTGARKEYEGQQGTAATEAGLAIGRGMSAETARLTNEATLRSNEMIRDAQMALTRVQDEGLRQTRIEAARAATLRTLTPLHNRYKAYSDQLALGVKLTPEQTKDMQALEKQLQLEANKINDRFDNMMVNSGAGSSAGFKVERIK